MPSPKQIEANRLNAKRSSGPRTEAGKAQSRLNALKHGLRAEGFEVLPNENAEAYQARLELWIDDYQPADAAEEQLVRHAADLTWKLDRTRRYDTASLTIQIQQARLAAAESPTLTPMIAETLASFDPSIEGERLRRYQFALSREFIRTIETIKKLQRDRARATSEASSETTSSEDRLEAHAPSSPQDDAPNEPDSSSKPAPNEPKLAADLQLLFGTAPVRAAESTQIAAPNEANRPRPITRRDRAIAKMIKRAQTKR